MDFSIIIPAKNEAENIKLCLQSIAEVTYSADKYEILLIDNGSIDSTVSIAESFGVDVFIKPELTISGLRNFAAARAQGKILAFLDADCTVFPDWLNTASHWLDREDVGCFGSPPEVPSGGTWVQKSWFIVRGKIGIIEEVDWLESMNMFVRKDIFEIVNGFDENLQTCEDYDLSLRLKAHGRIVSDHRIRAVHHGEASTLSHYYRKESWRGQSNLTGLLQHGFHWRELPSLLVPIIYLLCFVLTFLFGIMLLVGVEFVTVYSFVIWLLLWQIPILFVAFYKGSTSSSRSLKFGLYLLLNIYFLARARAMFRTRI